MATFRTAHHLKTASLRRFGETVRLITEFIIFQKDGELFFLGRRGGCHSAMVESRRLSDRWRTLTQLRLTNVLLTINFIFLSVKRVCWGREILDCGGERERRRNLIPLMVNRSKGWYTIQNLSSVRPSSGCS